MTSNNLELKNYVESLDNYDEKNQAISKFIEKLDEKFDIQPILAKFEFKDRYFEKLDNLLIRLGYCGRDDLIAEIKEFLRIQLMNISVIEYNKRYKAQIWNHYELLFRKNKITWKILSGNPSTTAVDILKKNIQKINWYYLSGNPAGVDLLKDNLHNIDWWELSGNPSPAAIEILMANKDKIYWNRFSGNPAAYDLIEQHMEVCARAGIRDKISWDYIMNNPACINLIRDYIKNCKRNNNTDNICWSYMSCNPAAIDLLVEHIEDCKKLGIPNDINWDILSNNPAGIDILLQNPNQITKYSFYENTAPAAIEIIKKHKPNEIKWEYLVKNPAAIGLIKENLQWVKLRSLSGNPYNYDAEKIAHFNGAGHFPRSHLEI